MLRHQLFDLLQIGGGLYKVPGQLFLRGGKNGEDLPFFHHPSVIHDRHPAADLLDHRHFVGNDHNGDSQRFVKLL